MASACCARSAISAGVALFQLAQDIDDEKAVAKFADGVLELTLPKRAAATSKRLAIN